MSVLKEYKQQEQGSSDLENITVEQDAWKAKYDGLRKQQLDEFQSHLVEVEGNVSGSFTSFFYVYPVQLTYGGHKCLQMITLGRNTELEMVNSMGPFAEGIIFSVMPLELIYVCPSLSQLHYTLWMKLMQLWTSEMCLLLLSIVGKSNRMFMLWRRILTITFTSCRDLIILFYF